jgi:hypothetical protein
MRGFGWAGHERDWQVAKSGLATPKPRSGDGGIFDN